MLAILMLLACSHTTEPAPTPWEGLRLHLTLDDAPWQTRRGEPPPPAAEVRALNHTILEHLDSREVPASVFFNCDRLADGDDAIAAWRGGGHVVGNHTAGHARLDLVGCQAWLAEVDGCHEVLTASLVASPTWFRYPYLNHGTTEALRDEAVAGLAVRGYRNAPVTVATSDWVLAFAYVDAHGDEVLREQIGRRYVEHMVASVDAGREMARLVTDREVRHTVLVHVNVLNAEWLDDVLDAFGARGATFVDLPTAMADPVYGLENRYAGGGGVSWLARVAPDRVLGDAYWFGHEEGRLRERYLPGEY